jgi:hypothetical protein
VDVDDLVVKAHLPLAFEKQIYLVDFRVAVPITSLLARFICRGGDTNNVSVELMVNDTPACSSGGGYKSPKVITPRIQGPNVGHAVVAHGPRA